METIILTNSVKHFSNKVIWTGRIISGLCVIFLLFDAVMKLIEHPEAVKGTVNLGWPIQSIIPIGIILLSCTLLYLIPRTALIGCVLLTGYLGGAVATMARIEEPYYFPLIFGLLLWIGLFLRSEKLRSALS